VAAEGLDGAALATANSACIDAKVEDGVG